MDDDTRRDGDEISDDYAPAMERNKAEFTKWLEGRPAIIQEMARAHPGWQCYRLKNANALGHYRIYSYDENGTVLIQHGRDSHNPGLSAFGVNPDDLIVCGCGRWLPATDAQMKETLARIEAMRDEHLSKPCNDPDCRLHKNAQRN